MTDISPKYVGQAFLMMVLPLLDLNSFEKMSVQLGGKEFYDMCTKQEYRHYVKILHLKNFVLAE